MYIIPYIIPYKIPYMVLPRRYRIEGGGDRVSVHFAVTSLDCLRSSFCVSTITKAADLM